MIIFLQLISSLLAVLSLFLNFVLINDVIDLTIFCFSESFASSESLVLKINDQIRLSSKVNRVFLTLKNRKTPKLSESWNILK